MNALFETLLNVAKKHLVTTVLLVGAGTALGYWGAHRHFANAKPQISFRCTDSWSCGEAADLVSSSAETIKDVKLKVKYYEARENYRLKACDYGYANACYKVAMAHIITPLIDGAREVSLLARACDLNYPLGCFQAGNFAQRGIYRNHGTNGIPTGLSDADHQKDRDVALPYFRKGCRLDDQDSCNAVFAITGSFPDPQPPQ